MTIILRMFGHAESEAARLSGGEATPNEAYLDSDTRQSLVRDLLMDYPDVFETEQGTHGLASLFPGDL